MPFPLNGIAVESAMHEQPELTTIDAHNVWVYDPLGRARGAQRPGLSKMWASDIPDSSGS